ncbi:MAG TPA: YCF48-related protein, partial [Candidatus Kryptonia bacterium]|nr:YCF48-related protein [Candidatus Kryptonia bacterium]
MRRMRGGWFRGAVLLLALWPGAVAAAPKCHGDCDGGGTVTVDELAGGVAIALGIAPLAGCQSVDVSGNGVVTVDELVSSVADALYGCQANPTWQVQNPLPAANGLNGVKFVNALDGATVGNAGTLLLTMDGGVSWQPVGTGVAADLAAVDGNAELLVAVGNGGAILRSTDAGLTWQTVASDSNADLVDVSVVSATEVWAVGERTVLHSTDGGWSWSHGAATVVLLGVAFVDPNHGWVVGDKGLISATTDGGRTWQAQVSGTAQPLRALAFADQNHGWAVGDKGTVIHTTDGGANWLPQMSGTELFVHHVRFVDEQQGWAVAGAGVTTVLHTIDAGTTWSPLSGTPSGVVALSFIDPQHGWAAGLAGGLYQTDDAGMSWQRLSRGTTLPLSRAVFVDALHGWVAGGAQFRDGEGVILRTDNGGSHWTEQNLSTSLHAVAFADTETGWVVGVRGTVLHSI